MQSGHHDITIIGAGVSSVFLAYTLMKINEHVSIHMIDLGKELSERVCGLDQGGVCTCDGKCSKYIGFAGLGKSEGKFNYTNDFGGELGRKIGAHEARNLMKEVDEILCKFGGGVIPSYSTKNEELSRRAAKAELKVLSTEVRHLGTRLAVEVFQKMYECMKDRVTFSFETRVDSISKTEDGFRICSNKGDFKAGKIVIGTGMSGSSWLKEIAASLGLNQGETRLDLGMRVEMKGDQLRSILTETFETKLKIERDSFSATTYCMNPNGRIIRKHQHGLVMPDGQNAREEDVPSANLNFSLFVPRYYPSHTEAMEAATGIIGGINEDRGRIVVQRLEDFKLYRRTETLKGNLIGPSLIADCGNIKEELPELDCMAMEEFMASLEKLIGEGIHGDTLLYGLDAKFYEPKLQTDLYFETEVPGLYLIGDCSGETHSLSQAAASGIYVGRYLGGQYLPLHDNLPNRCDHPSVR
ncbi:NAD(FAD)-utilizing dehydrogenase (plasmid) [Cytobacillus spongiae]|uniref:NAD(FAD)-utilizing dehydrogenase n=1 Tax=Cytobacillus spongiae TaxID=2901381 RepID=UPI001F3F5B12|nr:NAD(FAD)-utilizing dehydrogenase [Cytobacillus spongiae]UII58227.1 NAD(FAD)-utilizing dehydrogenase [Cytobacillus spongiae]